MARDRGMGKLRRSAVGDIARDHQPLSCLERRGGIEPVRTQDLVGGDVVLVRNGGDRLALGDDDRRPTLPVPVATGMNRSGHLSCGWRRRRRRLILRLILWL